MGWQIASQRLECRVKFDFNYDGIILHEHKRNDAGNLQASILASHRIQLAFI